MLSKKEFEEKRSEISTFCGVVASLLPQKRIISIHAPVKSGKRGMVEYLSLLCSGFTHVFISSFHRLADQEQRQELVLYGINVFSISNKKVAEECLSFLGKTDKVMIHLDESDYGSGSQQLLSGIWKAIEESQHYTILYSATTYEPDSTGKYLRLTFTPPSSYCGSKKFLEEGLIDEAEEFFYPKQGALSAQGTKLLTELVRNSVSDNGRNIGVLRLKGTCEGNSIYDLFRSSEKNLLKNYPDVDVIYVKSGSKDTINWNERKWWKRQTKELPILIVVEYMACRSTEWAGHDRLAWSHCYHPEKNASTILQADLRVAHYSTNYQSQFNPIKIYSFVPAFELDAGNINLKEYSDKGGILSSRVSTRVEITPTVDYYLCSNPPVTDDEKDKAWIAVKTWAEERLLKAGIRRVFKSNRFGKSDGVYFLGSLRGEYRKLNKNTGDVSWGIGSGARLEPVYEGGVLFMRLRYRQEDSSLVVETSSSSMYVMVDEKVDEKSEERPKCIAVLKTGEKKGQVCGKSIIRGVVCGRHSKDNESHSSTCRVFMKDVCSCKR